MAGILATPLRRHLCQRYIWFALAVALAVLAPNVVWQTRHGWISLEFYRNADQIKNVPTPPHVALLMQVIFISPGTFPISAREL